MVVVVVVVVVTVVHDREGKIKLVLFGIAVRTSVYAFRQPTVLTAGVIEGRACVTMAV